MNIQVLFLGDSLVYGYPFGPPHAWPSLVADELGLTISNHALNGASTWNMKNRMDRCLEENPKKIFLMGGVNDFLMGKTQDAVKENVLLMLSFFKSHEIPCVLGIPHPMNDRPLYGWTGYGRYQMVNKNLKAYRNWILSLPCPSINFYDPFLKALEENKAEDYYLDEIHLTKKGNAFFAKLAIESKVFL